MIILVLNSGSSSIKYKLFNMQTDEVLLSGVIEEVTSHEKSLIKLLSSWDENTIQSVDAIGHRVVHGGEEFSRPVLIDNDVKKVIKKLIKLAPLHNPTNLLGIAASENIFKNRPHVAVFDTAFHQTMPEKVYRYAVPSSWYYEHDVRRYGFHGSSHHYVSQCYAHYHDKPLESLNLITIHLGNGGSICAIKEGESVETSMGMTPLEGLVMGTRSGDIDPAIVLYMQQFEDNIDMQLNKKSGLKGICGKSDMRDILNSDDDNMELALDMYTHRIRKYIGAYALILGQVDALVFTGGIGENSQEIRERICKEMDIIGVTLDSEKNEKIVNNIGLISTLSSHVEVVVIKTDEEFYIAQATQKVLEQ
jgi:acetate kinase